MDLNTSAPIYSNVELDQYKVYMPVHERTRCNECAPGSPTEAFIGSQFGAEFAQKHPLLLFLAVLAFVYIFITFVLVIKTPRKNKNESVRSV